MTHSFSFFSNIPIRDIRSPTISFACVSRSTKALPSAMSTIALTKPSRPCFTVHQLFPYVNSFAKAPPVRISAGTSSQVIFSSMSATSTRRHRPKYVRIPSLSICGARSGPPIASTTYPTPLFLLQYQYLRRRRYAPKHLSHKSSPVYSSRQVRPSFLVPSEMRTSSLSESRSSLVILSLPALVPYRRPKHTQCNKKRE